MKYFNFSEHGMWTILSKTDPELACRYIDLMLVYWQQDCSLFWDQAEVFVGTEILQKLLKVKAIRKQFSGKGDPKVKIPFCDGQFKRIKSHKKFQEVEKSAALEPASNKEISAQTERKIERLIEKENKTKVKSMPKKEVLNSQSQAKKGEEQDEKSACARPTKSPPKRSGLPPAEGAGLALADLYEFLSSQFKVTTHNKSRFSMSCARCYQHYKDSAWHDTQGVKIRNWRGAAIQWMKIDGFSQKARPCPN